MPRTGPTAARRNFTHGVALACVAAVALAGCSAPDAAKADGPPRPPMEDGKYVIRIAAGNVFQPANVSIPAGAKVVWVVDNGIHDVTEGRSGPSYAWSSDDDTGSKLTPGDRYERTFDTPGTVHYRCILHASNGMAGTLTVE